MAEYIRRLEAQQTSKGYERILLLTHDDIKPFYASAGFEVIGPSDVAHGPLPWIEMRKSLLPAAPTVPDTQTTQSLPPGIMEALQRPNRTRPTVTLLSGFPNGLQDVLNADDDLTNKYDLLCPRGECGSVILKAKVAKWVERANVQV